jgi:hypothetical protein
MSDGKRRQLIDPAVAAMLEQGAKRKATRGKSSLAPKADWVKVNTRMDPAVRQRLKDYAANLTVPVEELLHVALTDFLDRLDAGEVELEVRPTVTRNTLL